MHVVFQDNRRPNHTFRHSNLFRSVLLAMMFIAIAFPGQLAAQENLYRVSPWKIGVSAGVNSNLYHGSAQMINPDLTISASFQNTRKTGLFAFPVIEYRKPGSQLGFSLNTGYESRRGIFDETFSTKLAYITVEPSIRANLLKTPFYFFSGPRIAFNVDKRFLYSPDPASGEPSGGTFSDIRTPVISFQIGAAYDILLSSKEQKNQVTLSPYLSFHPYFGQNPRTIESWNLTTIRTGIAIKFGQSRKIEMPEPVELPLVIATESEKKYLISDSRKLPDEPSKTDFFPLQDYVFYNLKPVEPVRTKPKASGKIENQLLHAPELSHLADKDSRIDLTKNNLISRLGKLMKENPSSTVSLTGMSVDGIEDGIKLAQTIRLFLNKVYQIDGSRIQVKGRKQLKIATKLPHSAKQLALIHERGRKVLIESTSKNLQLELRTVQSFSSGVLPANAVDEANLYGTITFKTDGVKEPLESWSVVLTDDLGEKQTFGPYMSDVVCLSSKSILGKRVFGKFDVSFSGKLKSGGLIEKDTTATFVYWAPPESETIQRFKILYEYNNLKAIHIFRQFLTDVITPQIPTGSKIVIHGHSESVTGTVYSPTLQLSELNDARGILESALAKIGRSDVQFVVFGLGKDQVFAPFRSDLHEDFANRTLVLDIITESKRK